MDRPGRFPGDLTGLSRSRLSRLPKNLPRTHTSSFRTTSAPERALFYWVTHVYTLNDKAADTSKVCRKAENNPLVWTPKVQDVSIYILDLEPAKVVGVIS